MDTKQTNKSGNKKVFGKRGVVKKSEDMSAWYTDVIINSKMADYSPVRGMIVYRPLSYSIWEVVQAELNVRLKKMGVENSYFPLFIPEGLLKREQSHVEGFAPELAVVTIGGNEELKEKLVVRPTSETIMYEMYAKWVHTHKDLPILLNQWNNVVRWEKRTYFFLRGMEFLWSEAHTAHATHDESWKQTVAAIDAYAEIYEDVLAVPVIKGRKSDAEKFAGADVTVTVEGMMPDGKALQGGTSHDLGQNFSKVFNISFQDKDGSKQFAWQTSFGYSTRALGAMIMVHGDDQGLVLPPKVAPVQVVVLPIGDSNMVTMMVENIKKDLEGVGIRVKVDSRDQSLGQKRNDWELKGVPVRVELGEKELEARQVGVAVRHNSEKLQIGLESVTSEVTKLLDTIQSDMLNKARKNMTNLTSTVDSYDEFKKVMETKRGFIHALWCEDAACENAIKDETKASTRCLPFDAKEEKGVCVKCGKAAKNRWLFAQAY